MISVHRGLWGRHPENSRSAINAAHAFGIVEIDLQLAKSGGVVVFHDDVLPRMTGKPGRLDDRTLDELTSLRLLEAAGGNNARQTDELIPSLEDVLNDAPQDVYFDFDVKHPAAVAPIAAEITRLGFAHLGSVKINVQNRGDIDRLLDLEKRYQIMVMAKVILPKAGLELIRDLTDAGVAVSEIWFKDLDELKAASQIAGDQMAISTFTLEDVHCCGLNDERAATDPDAVWGRLIDAGVSIIMTDRAPELSAWLG